MATTQMLPAMHRAPQTIAHRDIAMSMALRSHASSDTAALVEASNELQWLNLPKASKVPRVIDPRRVAYPFLPGRLDYSLDGAVTRTKRAAKDPPAIDRMSSEVYPERPPRVDFFLGRNTRFDGRDPVVLVP